MTRVDYLPVPTAVEIAFQEGLRTYVPPADMPASKFQIIGSDYSQILEINLAPGQVVSFEPGTMMHMADGVVPRAELGSCAQGCARCCCLGESCFRLNVRNNSDEHRAVAFTPIYPARIVPVNMAYFKHGIFVAAKAFLGAFGTDWVDRPKRVKTCITGCCGGQGFFLNKIESDSWIFLAAGGAVLEKQLASDEVMQCETSALVAFEPSVRYSVKKVEDCATCCCGGMGMYNTELTGPGMVLLSSMSIKKLQRNIGKGGSVGGGGGGDGGGGD